MRIAVIGGRYKNEAQLARIAEARGFELEFEEGHTAGHGMEGIRKAVSRSELVVIVTDVNSHGAVHIAKKAARQLNRPTLIIQNFGAARLSRLLDALERRQQVSVGERFTHVYDSRGGTRSWANAGLPLVQR